MKKNNIMTISEANQNFSKVAKACKENGDIYILKNNKPCFLLKSISDFDDMEQSDCKKIERIYDECKNTITPTFETEFHSSLIGNEEIKKFFICVADFFLQRRQEAAIKAKRY